MGEVERTAKMGEAGEVSSASATGKTNASGETGGSGTTGASGSTGAFRGKIRLATRADAAALREIYAHYVENTTVSFEYEAPSVAEMERRIAEVEGVYPFLVCVAEIDGGERVVGYALAHRAFERAAYSWVAETAVYVDRDWRRRGIGEALYSALIETLEAQGVRTLYAVVVAENKASVEFHRRAGYRDFATFKNSGWKFNRWLDVVWLERSLGVWRGGDEQARDDGATEGNGGTSDGGKGGASVASTNPAPTPVRPLAEFAEEGLSAICAAASRRLANGGESAGAASAPY